MDLSSAPAPQLSNSIGDTPPPPYTFPTTFLVGKKRTEPFVTKEQLKGHLALLREFASLRSQIDVLDAGTMLENKEKRWAWFVGLAVER